MYSEGNTPDDALLGASPDPPADPDAEPVERIHAAYIPVDAEGRIIGDPALVSWLSTDRDRVTIVTSSAPALRVVHQAQPLGRPPLPVHRGPLGAHELPDHAHHAIVLRALELKATTTLTWTAIAERLHVSPAKLRRWRRDYARMQARGWE